MHKYVHLRTDITSKSTSFLKNCNLLSVFFRSGFSDIIYPLQYVQDGLSVSLSASVGNIAISHHTTRLNCEIEERYRGAPDVCVLRLRLEPFYAPHSSYVLFCLRVIALIDSTSTRF